MHSRKIIAYTTYLRQDECMKKSFWIKGAVSRVSSAFFAFGSMDGVGKRGHLTREEKQDKIFLFGMVPNWLK